jgi:RimJ/RimL family protein N-acetyltransferase
MSDVIATERLDLLPMSPAFLRCTVAGRHEEAEAILGLRVPPAWFECTDFAALQLRHFEAGATSQPWMPRAIRWRETGAMVGHIGFHTPPRPEYLKTICPAGVEFGYTIFSEYRRRRFAWEATRGLMTWAQVTHGVGSFVVSASPDNAASLALIAQLGFRRIGAHVDEVDGPEDIFALVLAEPSSDPPSAPVAPVR